MKENNIKVVGVPEKSGEKEMKIKYRSEKMSTKKTTQNVAQMLLNYRQTAEFLGISVNHLIRLNNAEKIPAPIRMGKSIRFNQQELQNWINAGGPSRNQWQRMKGE